jgi:drug/metabolite transporter (DMT)-like permease
MKSALFALAAIALFSLQAAIIKQKIAQVSPLANMMVFYLFTLVFVVPAFFITKTGTTVVPQGGQWGVLAICAFLLFLADFCMFSAYHAGGKLVTITTIACLMPVFASIISWTVFRDIDITPRHVLGWVMAAAAVWLVSK